MPMTAEQLISVRNQISDRTPPADADLHARFDVLGDPQMVVAEVLQKRLATLLASPAQFSVPGEYSQSQAENIKQLQDQLAGLGAAVVGAGGSGSINIVWPEDPDSR